MNKLISVATFLTAASTPVLGADIEPKAAVDFVLSTCFPAMEDLTTLEKIGQEKGWFRFPDQAPNQFIATRAHWSAPGFSVIIWDRVSAQRRNCVVQFRNVKVMRNAFFGVISSDLQLTPESDSTSNSGLRTEAYGIVGQKLNLFITSKDSTMFSSTINGEAR